MKKRPSYEIKEKILRQVKETPGIHPNTLNYKIGTNPASLTSHLQNLEDSEEIKVEHTDKDPANGKPSTFLYPTAKGNKTLENIRKRKKTEK
ncbi:MAG: hypothetical protein AABW53_01395 [Nanoarchaeota archaeon]